MHHPGFAQGPNSDDEESCDVTSDQRGRQRRTVGGRPWWQFWGSKGAESQGSALGEDDSTVEGLSPGPSSAVAGSDGMDNSAGSAHPTGPWVQHTTDVRIGDRSSPHYTDADEYYGFPLLGNEEVRFSCIPL